MVDDEHLARHVEQHEHRFGGGSGELTERVERLEENAAAVHDELARRIDETRAQAVDGSTVEKLVERLADIEQRLSAVEEQL